MSLTSSTDSSDPKWVPTGPLDVRARGYVELTLVLCQITAHHSDLLGQTANLSTLESALQKVTSGLTQVDSGVERLRAKIQRPYTNLAELLDRHDAVSATSDLSRRVQRAVLLSKRLRGQMQALREVALDQPNGRSALRDAALTCADIDSLLQGGALADISALEPHLAQVEDDRLYILDQMQTLLNQGLQQSVSISNLRLAMTS